MKDETKKKIVVFLFFALIYVFTILYVIIEVISVLTSNWFIFIAFVVISFSTFLSIFIILYVKNREMMKTIEIALLQRIETMARDGTLGDTEDVWNDLDDTSKSKFVRIVRKKAFEDVLKSNAVIRREQH